MTQLADTQTLGDARGWLRQRISKGAECPCCKQFAKVYRRKFNSSMARALIHFYRHDQSSDTPWFHADLVMKQLNGSRGDYCKIAHWDLIVAKPNTVTSKKDSGWWRFTDRGRRFVNLEARLPAYVKLYAGRLLGFEGELISIKQALGRHFDYYELMGERPDTQGALRI